MMKELCFKNLTIRYDGEEFSKSIMRKVKTIENIGTFVILVVFFGVMALSAAIPLYLDNCFVLSVLIGFTSMIIVLFGGSSKLTEICKRFSPRHYEFVTQLMKYKSDEIEIGWLNDRYVVNIHGQHGWVKKEFGRFVDEDYRLEDKADKSKPVHMTIDLVNGDVEVTVEN